MNILNGKEYIENFLYIRTKEGALVKLRMNPAQRKLYAAVRELSREGKPIRIIVLKARQMGFSTLISALIFHACAVQPNRAALLVAHLDDATANLHKMHKLFYDKLPGPLQPLRAASNAREMLFQNPSKDPEERKRVPGLRSKIRCATAGGKGIGRSDTLQFLHVSEYAFWPDGLNSKEDTLLGVLQAVPALPGTMVFIESTARGFDDFKHRWDDAVSGRSDFVPMFFPWFEDSGYRREVEPGTVWSDEERELMERFGLEPEQLAWRRWCIVNNCGGDLDKFHQEYPATPEEAFIASGNCWFDTVILMARLRELEEADGRVPSLQAKGDGDADSSAPLRSAQNDRTGARTAECRPYKEETEGRCGHRPLRGRFTYKKVWDPSLRRTVISDVKFVERKDGPVTVWREPMERVPYVIGGDTAGEGSDWFSAYAVDNTDASTCARLYMRHDEAEYTAQVYCLGVWYNKALIGLEVNFSTYPTRSLQDWGYPRLYVRMAEDSYTHKPEERFGWRTDRLTRPAMLAELRETVEAHPEILRDPDLIREMLTFVKNKDGRPEAMEGEHDDLVMGYGITLRIRDQQSAVRAPEPGSKGNYTQDMLDDYWAASPSERAMLEARWGKPF